MSRHTDTADPTTSTVPLTYREVRFVNLYLESGNATESARGAGYKSVSEQGLSTLACALLKKPHVAAYYAECLTQYLDAERITRPKLAQSFNWEAFADRTQIFDEHGDVINPRDWPVELKALVVGFDASVLRDPVTKEVVGTKYKVKFANPTEAKKVLAEWRGLIGPKAVDPAATAAASVTVIIESESPTPEPEEESP